MLYINKKNLYKKTYLYCFIPCKMHCAAEYCLEMHDFFIFPKTTQVALAAIFNNSLRRSPLATNSPVKL